MWNFKVLQAILLICLCVQTSTCQSPRQDRNNSVTDGKVTIDDPIERQVSDMTKILNLNNQQKDQIRSVLRSYKPMGDATREQWKKMTPDEQRKVRMASHLNKEKHIEAILTPQQKESYERILADQRARVGAFITTRPAPQTK